MAKLQTQQIRNVAVLGHGGAGKTSLTEALLFKTGATTRVGRVEDGTTVSDWDNEEQRRQISINLSVVPVDYNSHRLNLIDSPGYQDFIGEVISALHAAEAGIILVDAVAGCEVGTELAWDRLNELKKARIIFVNKMDRENANFDRAVESLRATLTGSKIVPFQLPIGVADSFKGVAGLVDMKAYLGKEGKEAPGRQRASGDDRSRRRIGRRADHEVSGRRTIDAGRGATRSASGRQGGQDYARLLRLLAAGHWP